ncbi:MAG: alkylmercury lyase family protein, partial [Saprospiraceae bacterium]|nr:alkylmercury lyase family protein [Saprospiraceae bacterium]
MRKNVSTSTLHYTIISQIIRTGFAPSIKQLARFLQADRKEIIRGLFELQEYHGVVLHPKTPKIWAIHPFSLAPTNFYVQSTRGEWWGNCAWCSLGIAALLKEDVKITTTIGAETKQIAIHIVDGEIQEKNYLIHFPIPMRNAWDNVIYS